jgi:hypothetical protein
MTTLATPRSLLKILEQWNIDYILIGSVAAAVYGVDVQAGDLDVVPDTAHVDELLARISIPRREKDRDRVGALREIQRRNGSGAAGLTRTAV